MSKQGLKMSILDSKLYYKLRHNLLKTYVLANLNFENLAERPFKSYPELGSKSERTPDFLQRMDQEFLLIEFTFCNKYESVLRTKEIFSKYDPEIKESQVPILDFYVFMSLDKDIEDTLTNIFLISEKFNLQILDSIREELEDVHNTVCSVTAYLNDFLPELLSLNIDKVDVQINVNNIISVEEPFPLIRNIVGRKAVKNVRVKSLLNRFNKRLIMSLRRKPNWGKYMIVINFVTTSSYIEENPDGMSKEELLNMLDLSSESIFECVKVIGDFYTEREILAGRNPDLLKEDLDRKKDEHVYPDVFNYERLLMKRLTSCEMNTVADCDLSVTSKDVYSVYNENLEKLKKSSNTIEYKSSPFIFYPTDLLVKGPFNVKLPIKGSLTEIIVRQAFKKNVKDKRTITRNIDYDSMSKLNTLVAKEGYNLRRKYLSRYLELSRMRNDKFLKLVKEDESLRDMKEFRDLKSKYKSYINEETKLVYENRLRINLKTNSRWDSEMDHFKREKNVHRIVSGLDIDTTRNDYQSLLNELFNPTNTSVDDKIFSETIPLGDTLAKNCEDMARDLRMEEEVFRTTRLCHSTLFISQWSYSLMFYSNIKLNKDDFIYDNLGYENTLLIVKGGKKIRSTRTSRFFRLLFPITESQFKIVNSNSNETYFYKGQRYLLTPWTMLRIPYLKKGFELFSNFGSFYISDYKESNLSLNDYQKFISIKVLLMFSQKRKLEVWFSSLRYIFFNSLGTHTDVLSLLGDMAILEYDSLIFLLQRSFFNYYTDIVESVRNKRLFDLVWLDSVDNFDLMAERFEENIFMSKAPFNPVSEHLKNLKSLFDTHKYFIEKVGTCDPIEILSATDKCNSEDYYKELEECDFNFDSKQSYLMGDFAGSYISTNASINELMEKFNDCMTRNFTEISTSKGMREDHGAFWGKKGHDVVYNKLHVNVGKILKEFPQTPNEYNRLIKSIEQTFVDKINNIKKPQLLFDMKDKEQYKGSREIYVMSEETKLMQNPLEKFFAKLCSFFPNELIHKPSSSRPRFIHSKMFEHTNEEAEIMYCTMDCRKWAPRSNLWKYYFFIQGMAKYLPENFTDYFFKFWTLMFTKKVKIQSHYIEKLITNEGYKHITEYLSRDGEDYCLTMPYSFMMGIFNYLSSLMHAASQIYFADKIARNLKVDCNFVAHSDDSAGILLGKNYEQCLKVFKYYEKFQRGLNHLMSRKKCSLSKRSFEIISIMYCDKEFIPMTHKFLSNVSFDPKGAGWYDDVAAITGKIVDLYNNGGSYLQCYAVQLAMSELLRKAYHLPRTELLSHIPVAFGGVINYHPVHSILIGSRAQECLLDLVEDEKTRSTRIKTYITISGDYNTTIGSKVQYQFPYYRNHEDALDLTDELKDKLSAISTLPFRSTLISILKHKNKLFDKQYVYSLTGVDTNQIMLSTLFYKCSVKITDNKLINLKDIVDAYGTLYKTDKDDEIISYTYPKGNYMSYFRQTESLKISYQKVNIVRRKVCKPVIYNTLENFSLRLSQDNMMILSAIEKNPDIKNIFTNPMKYDGLKQYLMNSLPGSDDEKLHFIKNFDPSEKEDRVRSGYLFIPSQIKIDTPSRFFTYSLLYTSRRYMISSQKPQLFTPSEFSLESKGFEFLKHQYLCFKLIARYYNDKARIEKIQNSLQNCTICCKNQSAINEVSEYLKYLNYPEFRDFIPQIPFCDYTTSQIRGKNVWYSSADFKIYTHFGTVESKLLNGDIWTTWTTDNSDHLQSLWNLYRIFCNSRGINYERPVYQDTGFSTPRLAFTDFDTPYIPMVFTTGMVLSHSQIIYKESVMPRISRRGKKFFLNDRVVEFELYAIYDISQTLFNMHNLQGLRDIIYTLDLKVDRSELLEKFNNSKAYRITLNDPLHSSISENKYNKTEMLGTPGSFSRALTISDELKQTRYRTSYNPKYITKGAIEFDTVEGVPIMDMFEKVNYARMRPNEKLSFEKALSGETLTYSDQQNLINIKNKMGLEALGTALVLHKHIFRNMVAGSVGLVSEESLLELLHTSILAIHDCMENFPRENLKEEFRGSPLSFFCILKTYIDNGSKPEELSLLIVRGLLRAKADNGYKFWGIISNNVLLSSMIINNKNFLNLISMYKGIIVKLKKKKSEAIYDPSKNVRFKKLMLANIIDSKIEGDSDDVNEVIMFEGEPLILDSDAIDAVTGGDDLDEDEEYEEREYNEDNDSYKALCLTDEDIKIAMQTTALEDFSSITILNPVKFVCFPWLGKGDYDYVTKDRITYYRSYFPGSQNFKSIDIMKANKVSQVEFRDIAEDNREKFLKAEVEAQEKRNELKEEIDRDQRLIDDLKIQISRKMLLIEESEGNIDFEAEMKSMSLMKKSLKELKSANARRESQYKKMMDNFNLKRRQREAKQNKMLPKILKNREDAIESLKMLNIFNPRLVNKLFPETQVEFESVMDKILNIFEENHMERKIDEIIRNRSYGRSNLPGFQGLLEDSVLLAELKALFGDNCYSLIQGSVRLTTNSYNYYKRMIERLYSRAEPNDKAILMFMMSILMDTVTHNESDVWFTDNLNSLINEIDLRQNPAVPSIMLPVNTDNYQLQYTELDLFD